jgi:hypothetical protein
VRFSPFAKRRGGRIGESVVGLARRRNRQRRNAALRNPPALQPRHDLTREIFGASRAGGSNRPGTEIDGFVRQMIAGALRQPVVSNGLSLTKIHHAAFDADLIGADPDFRIHVL